MMQEHAYTVPKYSHDVGHTLAPEIEGCRKKTFIYSHVAKAGIH
jgi:hypothetical protein